MKQNDYDLSAREQDVLNILWASSGALTASAIVKMQDGLTVNTVQSVLKRLMRKKFIKVDEIVYSGNVLCRAYIPTYTQAEFMTNKMMLQFKSINEISASSFVASLLEQEEDSQSVLSDIEEIEKVLNAKKAELTQKDAGK